jgi:hypothetical protein
MPCNFTYYFTISMNLQYHFTATYQYFACKHNKQFWNFSKIKTVNTRLESKLILAKCRKSLICLENTSHNIFQKNLKMYLLLWKLAIFLCQLINVYIHITEKTAFMTKSIFSLFTYLQFSFCFEIETYFNLTKFSS